MTCGRCIAIDKQCSFTNISGHMADVCNHFLLLILARAIYCVHAFRHAILPSHELRFVYFVVVHFLFVSMCFYTTILLFFSYTLLSFSVLHRLWAAFISKSHSELVFCQCYLSFLLKELAPVVQCFFFLLLHCFSTLVGFSSSSASFDLYSFFVA